VSANSHVHHSSLVARDVRAGWAAARMALAQFEDIERKLMEKTERKSPEDVFEAEAGSQLHLAITASDAQGACERAYEEFQYDDEFPADVLEALRIVKDAEIKV
jgi:hypothetical protein